LKGKSSKKRKSKIKGAAIRPFHSLSLLQFSVILIIMGSLVAMAIPVWSNIRQNAYEAEASANHERGKEAVETYWFSKGQEQDSYKGLTASYIDRIEPGVICAETDVADLEKLSFDQMPFEYFSSILILRDSGTPADEIAVAAIAKNGKVFYSRFKKADVIDSGQFAFSDLGSGNGERLQASAKTGSGTE
jgi:hypothetical protein